MPQRMWSKRDRSQLLRRLLVVGIMVSVWIGVLYLRLFNLQISDSAKYRDRSINQQRAFIEVLPRRGEILDRNLTPLAVSVPVRNLFAHPHQIADVLETAAALAPILDQSTDELLLKLTSHRRFVFLAQRIPPRVAEQAVELGLAGIGSELESRRAYPSRQLASHVLGFVGAEGKGLSGLEYRYEDQLRGRGARIPVRVDAKRRSYSRQDTDVETGGNSLVLTIDQQLQFIAEEVLGETVESSGAKSGSVVLMDPENGAVLAMASYPTFNPNLYSESRPENYRNRAIRSVYEPGSTFKIVTLSAILNEGLLQEGEIIDCRVGTVRLGNKVYRESSRSYGHLNFDQIVANSSNVGTIKLGLRLGEERLFSYIRRLGFGEKSGIDLPGEEVGLLRPTSQWSKLSIGSLSIGQEIFVTPVQIVTAASVVANGGFQVQPHVVSKIVKPGGELVWTPKLKRRRLLEAATSRRLKTALAKVVEIGTGAKSRLSGYTSAGKTGTAQKIVNGVYSRSRYVPSFVGFAPVDAPRLAAVVVIEEPRGKYYAGEVVAPAFREIMERSLIHLKIAKDRPPEVNPGNSERDGRRFAGNRELPASPTLSLRETASGSGARSGGPSRLASKDSAALQRHVIRLERGSTGRLPNVAGMSLRQVLAVSNKMGLVLEALGTGTAVKQAPAPGTVVGPSTKFEVHFSNRVERIDATSRTGRADRSTGGS